MLLQRVRLTLEQRIVVRSNKIPVGVMGGADQALAFGWVLLVANLLDRLMSI